MIFQVIQISKPDTTELFLEATKQEKVCRGQVRRVSRVIQDSCVGLVEQLQNWVTAVGACIVIMQNVVSSSPVPGAPVLDGNTQTLQNLAIQVTIHSCVAMKLPVDYSSEVKEDNK